MPLRYFMGAALMLGLAPALGAQTPATPPPSNATGAPKPVHVLDGFRSAHFGMTEAEVRAAAIKDFGTAANTPERSIVKGEGTTALTIRLPQLVPGIGAATVTYVLGATSARLIHINVVWLVPGDASPADRLAQTAAGLKLTTYFDTFAWAPGSAVRNIPIDESSVVMFMARDGVGAAVEVRADGVQFKLQGKSEKVVTGPVALTISYGQSPKDPDVRKITPGTF